LPSATFPGFDQQGIGLDGPVLGHQVVGVLEVDGVDVDQVDELLDVDGPAGLGVDGVELLGVDDDIATPAQVVALDDVVVVDFLAVDRAHAFLVDTAAVGVVELVEPDVFR